MSNILENAGASKINEKLYLNAEFADVDFIFDCDGEIERVPANRAILAAESSVFKSMFFGIWEEEDGDVKIVDATPEAFKEFLQFFYLTKVIIAMENIESVARLADKYDVLHFLSACAQLFEMKLTKENMCYAYQMALHLKDDALIKFCEREISLWPKDVFASESFIRCDLDTLERILELGLNCKEVDIFDACLKWAKYSCENDYLIENAENIKLQLGNCLTSIRFSAMKIEEFTKYYALYRGLFAPDEFEDIVLMLTVKGHKSRKFNQLARPYVWNKDNAIKCKRIRENTSLRNYTNLGVVWFTTNHCALLGEISGSHYILKDNSMVYKQTFDVNITILALDSHSKAPVGVLYEESHVFDNNEPHITLSQPILLKPDVTYEISVTSTDMVDGLYHNTAWKSVAEPESGFTIQFHRDPSLTYDNIAIGWICGMNFNRI